MRYVQILIIGISAWIITCGDSLWETLWPKKFWKQKVSELEISAKNHLWNLKSVEWEVMKGRIALSISVSEAEDKADCLGVNCDVFVKQAKEEAFVSLQHLMQEEQKLRLAYQDALKLLMQAKDSLKRLDERTPDSRAVG